MNPWLRTVDWDAAIVALFVWVVILTLLAWFVANFSTRPPRHH